MLNKGVFLVDPAYITIKGSREFFQELAEICKQLTSEESTGMQVITISRSIIHLIQTDDTEPKTEPLSLGE